jgi:hypothetical protein
VLEEQNSYNNKQMFHKSENLESSFLMQYKSALRTFIIDNKTTTANVIIAVHVFAIRSETSCCRRS